MRDFLRQFMLYSRAERRAVIALVVIIMIVIAIPRAYHFYALPAGFSYRDSTVIKQLAITAEDTNTLALDKNNSPLRTDSLFNFDPNTINISGWIKLGLSEKQAAVIEKYRSKGGRFRQPDDLRKIYVISEEMKDKLVPCVRIVAAENGIKGIHNSKSNTGKAFYSIEINTADSAAFEALYGIGPALSSRIIKYRRILGGFYKVEQIGETYGVSDSTFQLIKPHLTVDISRINKIDINTAEYETLRKHPYIHAKIAHAVIDYRNRNGKFENLEQLKILKPMTDDVFIRIQPYFTITE
jgi:competence protein ComEA